MNTAYVISLDALDLSLLPSTYQPRRSMTPIWNRNDELTEYMIQVTNTTTNEALVTEVQSSETTMCHLCKIDVPKNYLREHKNSLKHKTHTRIANIALKRIKEQINDECECDDTRVHTSTYFCTHCNVAVKNDDRHTHEASHSHKNSLFVDQYLSNFLNLYTNTDKADVEDIFTTNVKINKNENKFELKNYLKILKNKYKLPLKLKIVDNERVQVEVDGTSVEVPAQNFHGLKTTSSGLECVVCKETVQDEIEHIMRAKHMYRVSTPFKDIHCKREIYPALHHCVLCNIITDDSSSHSVSDPEHQRLLQEALRHKQDNYTDSMSTESWSLVTNKTSKSDATTKESSHTDNNSMTCKDDPTANKTFCSYCNVYIGTKNFNKHKSTKKHLCNTVSKYYYTFITDSCTPSCRVCDVIVMNVDDFEKHINSSEHVNRYNDLLAINKVSIIDSNQLFCNACDKLVLIKNEFYHIEGRDHIQNLSSNNDPSPTTSSYQCDVCDVRVLDTATDIQDHNESMTRNIKKNTSKLVTESTANSNTYYFNYTMLETQEHNLVNCYVCHMLILKDKEVIQKHLENESHIGKYKQLLLDHSLVLLNDNIHCNVCDVFVGLKSEIMHARGKKHLKNLGKTKQKHSVALSVEDNFKLETRVKAEASGVTLGDADLNFILEYFDVSDNLKQLVCRTCKVTVPFTMYNCRGHLEGSKHKQILKETTSANSINS